MRYFRKTAFGVLALVLLAGAAWSLEKNAAQTAQADVTPVTAEPVNSSAIVAIELLYEEAEAEPTPEPTPAIPVYDIPLSVELQEYTYQRCEALGLVAPGIDYPTVLALMGKESEYSADAVSATGDYGLMQINTVNHDWLREELGITDFLDAKQSIDAGTEMLARLSAKYSDPHKVAPFTFATEQQPIFYFRLSALSLYRETNTVAWLNGVLTGHIFAPETARMKWLKALVDSLALDGEVIMLDKSPMFLTNIKADSSASPLAAGQLQLSVRFGLLRRKPYAHPLMHTYHP